MKHYTDKLNGRGRGEGGRGRLNGTHSGNYTITNTLTYTRYLYEGIYYKREYPLVTSTTKTHPPTEPISIWKRKMKTQRIGMVDTLSNAAYNPLTTSRKRPIDD